MAFDLDDIDDWVRVGKRGPDKGGRPPRFREAKLFMAKNAKRGSGFRVDLPQGAPKFVFCMGYTQRRGIGADSRTLHRNHLRSQANYNGRDGILGWAFSFDKDGPVDRVFDRVESWEDDKRYFRASLNPLDHEEIKDWQRFGTEFMETLQHGSQRTFDPEGKGLHWHSDGLLTDEDRAAGKEIDWVMSVHHGTGRAHTHVMWRGMIGKDDLYITRDAVTNLYRMGQGVASMDHHVGMHIERSQEIEQTVERQIETIQKQMQMEDRAVRRLSRELEID